MRILKHVVKVGLEAGTTLWPFLESWVFASEAEVIVEEMNDRVVTLGDFKPTETRTDEE